MEKGFAYLDKYGILHAVKDEELAKKSSKNGKVIAVENCDGTGYLDENGKDVFVYTDPLEFHEDGHNSPVISEDSFAKKYPITYGIYKELTK